MSVSALDDTLFSVQVTAASEGRQHWTGRSWMSEETREAVRQSNVVLLPWENFREGQPLLFPQGTTKFFEALKETITGEKISLAVDRPQYAEITLHSNHYRIPKMFLTAVLVPVVVGIVANRIDRALPDTGSADHGQSKLDGKPPVASDIVELEMIVEGEYGRCIAIKYKGPPTKLVQTVVEQVRSCLPQN